MAAGKRVRIQSNHGILIPGGLANSPRGRAMMWRSKPSQTVSYLVAALILWALFCTTRNLLQRDSSSRGVPTLADIPLDLNTQPRPVTPGSGKGAAEGLAAAASIEPPAQLNCPEYGSYASRRHEPFTGGAFNLPYQRPVEGCRKVVIDEVEEVIREMNQTVKDRDLFRLFENCFPNTLDTSVTWTGVSGLNPSEELTFITTGDIHAMWLRDSANQMQSYVSLLKPQPPPPKQRKKKRSSAATTLEETATKPSKLASLFRGAINLQARYLLASPHCNAFHAPAEAGMAPGNDGNPHDNVFPHYDRNVVFECKYELDSLAAFLQLSWDYYSRTKDAKFFFSPQAAPPTPPATGSSSSPSSRKKRSSSRRHRVQRPSAGWKAAVITILETAEALRAPTYTDTGSVSPSPYRFERNSVIATETLGNHGAGNPVNGGTGLVRSAFRPSDDATIYQFFIPANMMLAKYLDSCAEIMVAVEKEELRVEKEQEKAAAAADKNSEGSGQEKEDEDEEEISVRMKRMAKEIKKGVEKYGKVKHPDFGEILAYETDGFQSHNVMDDANLPSLLSAPLTSYLSSKDTLYRNTRKFILSPSNPYYGHGPVLNGTGGPHIGPGMVWPMSLIVGIMTSDDDAEIKDMLRQILGSTDFLGLIHESVNVQNQGMWTRSWFSWANGLFGQMMLDLKARKPHILKLSFQGEEGKKRKG